MLKIHLSIPFLGFSRVFLVWVWWGYIGKLINFQFPFWDSLECFYFNLKYSLTPDCFQFPFWDSLECFWNQHKFRSESKSLSIPFLGFSRVFHKQPQTDEHEDIPFQFPFWDSLECFVEELYKILERSMNPFQFPFWDSLECFIITFLPPLSRITTFNSLSGIL